MRKPHNHVVYLNSQKEPDLPFLFASIASASSAMVIITYLKEKAKSRKKTPTSALLSWKTVSSLSSFSKLSPGVSMHILYKKCYHHARTQLTSIYVNFCSYVICKTREMGKVTLVWYKTGVVACRACFQFT